MLINEISAFLLVLITSMFQLIGEKYEKFTKNNCKIPENLVQYL